MLEYQDEYYKPNCVVFSVVLIIIISEFIEFKTRNSFGVVSQIFYVAPLFVAFKDCNQNVPCQLTSWCAGEWRHVFLKCATTPQNEEATR